MYKKNNVNVLKIYIEVGNKQLIDEEQKILQNDIEGNEAVVAV